jgi:hypothetical protein
MGDMNGYCGPNSLPVDNWFSNENTDIKKKTMKNLHRFDSTQKDPMLSKH